MNTFLIILIALFIFFLGGVSHELDMKRNFDKHGNAKAWFVDIKK